MWFYREKKGAKTKTKSKKSVKRDKQMGYWVLGREMLREFEMPNLEGYNKFNLPFLWM